MCSKRDVVIFFAGAEGFHTLSHAFMFFMGNIDLGFMVVTPTLNLWNVLFNGAVTAGLLWWAYRLEDPMVQLKAIPTAVKSAVKGRSKKT